jgi:hypothetical protein
VAEGRREAAASGRTPMGLVQNLRAAFRSRSREDAELDYLNQ